MMHKGGLLLGTLALLGVAMPPPVLAVQGDVLVYFGTYTGARSRGIYVARFNTTTGKLDGPELAAETENPSFLAIHPDGKHLYAVNEVKEHEGKPAGYVTAFALDQKTGKLARLNEQLSGGAAPCHLIVDKAGRNVLVANYFGGTVAVLPLAKDGALRPPSSVIDHRGLAGGKQALAVPLAHGIYLDAANRFAYVADKGLDKIIVYRFDAKSGTLLANDPPSTPVSSGSGPRHFALAPSGRFAYVINESNCTVTGFGCDVRRGRLGPLQTLSTLPDGEAMKPGYSTAELFAHPAGKFLYGSNRGHDTIAVFAMDRKTGMLRPVENVSTQGKVPRGFGIDPTGQWLLAANQKSDTVVVFRIDAKSGRLTPTGASIEVGSPVNVEFLVPRARQDP